MRRRSGRRSSYDPLASSDEYAWLVVRDEFRNDLEVCKLDPRADLRRILTEAREARIKDGWACDDIGPHCSFFFCTKNGVRLMVTINRRDPALPRECLGCYPFTRAGET